MLDRSITEEIKFIEDLENLVTAYEEIAVMRIQRTRASVVNTRAFVDEMKKIMEDVRLSYRRALLIKKQTKIINKKKKVPLAVLISSDNRLSGSLVNVVIHDFINYVENNTCELLIVGKTGAQFYVSRGGKKEFGYFDFPDRILDKNLLSKIFSYANGYADIRFFYGKLITLMRQESFSDRMGVVTDEVPDKKGSGIVPFIFEPSLEDVSLFFDTEILVSLMSQAVREGQLAIWGSRVKAMEETTQRIEKKMQIMRSVENVARHSEFSKKQRQTIAGRILWDK